jgi:hypothetical protein
MVKGRPTVEAGLKPLWQGEWSLIGRQYGEYRDVLQQLKKIRDYNPDASLAVWNVLRLANSGHQVDVYTSEAGPDGQPVQDKEGKALVEDLAERAGGEYGGGVDTILDVFHLTLMTQGAIAAEVELSQNLREVVDLCPVDPRYIEFALDQESAKAVPVIIAGGAPKRINLNQFRYLPLDPDVGDPHGRAPLWSALETVFFQTEVLRDLKAVCHNQGYPRLDVSLLEEIILQNVPEHLKAAGKEDELRSFVDGFLTDLQSTYNTLEPDDTFIHWDWVKVTSVGGAGGGGGAIDVAKVIAAIDAQIVAGLKQLPILLGRNEGATTTHATVQWQIYVAGIEALQRRTKRLLEWMYNVALRVWGRQSYARVTFNAIRKSDRKAEAEAARIEADTMVMQELAGWVTHDEAAQAITGHAAPGVMTLTAAPGKAPATPQTEGRELGSSPSRVIGLAPTAPEGIPDWLWERAHRTGRAYQRWAEATFAEKMHAYLTSPEAVAPAEVKEQGGGHGGNGHEPPLSGARGRGPPLSTTSARYYAEATRGHAPGRQ